MGSPTCAMYRTRYQGCCASEAASLFWGAARNSEETPSGLSSASMVQRWSLQVRSCAAALSCCRFALSSRICHHMHR